MANTTNFGWETPDDTDLVKDGASAMRTLGNAIDTSLVDLKGGTTGQVLSKASNTDMDFTWVAQDDSNAIQNAIVDAKGDLITATAADTPSRIAVGTDGQILTADSTTATGLKWTTLTTGGTINYQAFTSSTTWTVPAAAKYVDVMVVGGGSGGAGGKRAVENSNYAGMGGAVTFADEIYLGGTGTVAITIGAGSNGTTGTATTTNAAASSNAGFSAFGTYCYSGGGISNSRSGIPGYKGSNSFGGDGYQVNSDSTQSNWAPSMSYNLTYRFYGGNAEQTTYGRTSGLNCVGFFGGFSAEAFVTANRNYAGGHPGNGEPLGTVVVTSNTIPQQIPSTWLTAVGSASAGTSGTGGGAGGSAGISGIAGGGGTCRPLAGGVGGQGGAGAGGGGSWPNPVGGTGGNGGNAGTNTGAGGGAGANTGSTTAGTGGTGGNGAAGLVVVRWIS